VEAAYRVQVLVNETRTEVKGSLVALIGLAFVTGFLVVEYRHMAPAAGLRAWVAAMGGLLTSWLAAWIGFVLRPRPTPRFCAGGFRAQRPAWPSAMS
jgi:hypothetical protein